MATQTYKCGQDNYEISCGCPGSACACKKNGQLVTSVSLGNGCPNCNFNFAQAAAACGVPY